ncbi:peptide deformylase [Treponema rectale]|uniref:Peptide deformylase n=1 Tax=Treponema rectale TaxID=744512 RepID=A0A840SKR4_9SPIR|nr:peptide deformylase [Treponema rectale]MBB5220053.1 peptide deformylase [Treponema rectale]QOS40634.1 peptide deformylase [Treponema rectale]
MRICKIGEEILSRQCEPVKPEEIDDSFRAILNEMFDTMISANGVGLAAPQVGIAKRFFVLMSDDDVKRVFINPEITKTSAETAAYEEGCLSIPGESESIVRPVKVSVTALNENGKRFTIEDADGLLARIIQHENDHLNGVLYIDRGDKDFKESIIEKFKKKAEKAAKKAAEKAAKKASLEAKLAAKKHKGN